MKPAFSLLIALALLTAGCSDAEEGAPVATDAPARTTTTGAVTSTETTTTTISTTTIATTEPPAPTSARHVPEFTASREGFGDPYDPELGNGGLDVEHYTLDLAFDPVRDVLSGQVTLDVLATEQLETFNLDFSGFEISAVAVDDEPAAFTREGKELTIAPPAPIPAGEGFAVTVSYRGTPEPRLSPAIELVLGWLTDPDGDRYVIAEPDAANTWFPGNDHPLDKATYTFRITVPDPLIAAANGELTDVITDLGTATYVWEMDAPMATYLATVVIGDYEVVADEAGTRAGGVPIRNVLPLEMVDMPPDGLALQGEMMAFFADRFGPYPFDEYGIVFVDDWPGALETQTLSVFGSAVLAAPDQMPALGYSIPLFEIVLVHELAHQWFGNSVSPGEWADIWLNEGFASYAEFLWIEHRFGSDILQAAINGERFFWVNGDRYPPGAPPYDQLFGGPVYRLGAMTLHALRLTVGDETFFEILRTYHERFAGGAAFTEDFIAVAEDVSESDLQDLFDAWLFSGTVPDFPTG